jgi:CDP-diacylglycerol--serine O-phosphatidyltransferase
MLFVIFAGYALLGPVERLIGLVAKVIGKRATGRAEQSMSEPKF